MTDKRQDTANTGRATGEEPAVVAANVADQITVDEETGRAYDPAGKGGQAAVAEALGQPPAGFDPAAEDRVPAEDKRPGVPPVT